jgi:hypothetical protein
MTAKTSGDSSPGVSHDIFQAIQDSFTTQGTQAEMAPARTYRSHLRVKAGSLPR